jgi:hypothetical protein
VTPGLVLINDQKLDATPAVAYLSGGHVPDIVVRAQYSESKGGGEQFFGANYVFAFHADGSPVAGWPVRLPSIMTFNGSAQEFITEAVNQPAVADVNGDGRDEVATGPSFGPTYLISGPGRVQLNFHVRRAKAGPASLPNDVRRCTDPHRGYSKSP